MYKRKLHSKFLAVPIRKLFYSITFSLFFHCASSPAVFAQGYLPVHSRYTFRTVGGIRGSEKSLSVDSCRALPRGLGLLQLFTPGYKTKYKNPPEISITHSRNRQKRPSLSHPYSKHFMSILYQAEFLVNNLSKGSAFK